VQPARDEVADAEGASMTRYGFPLKCRKENPKGRPVPLDKVLRKDAKGEKPCSRCQEPMLRGNGSAKYCLDCSILVSEERARATSAKRREKANLLRKAKRVTDTPEAAKRLLEEWSR
jgi:hypothetical protein